MYKYPLQIAEPIVNQFHDAHPRGWAIVCQLFYLRDETITFIFQKDQRLWFKFKTLVKDVDKNAHGATDYHHSAEVLNTLLRRSYKWREFWRFLKHSAEIFTDEMDYLTFVEQKITGEPVQIQLF